MSAPQPVPVPSDLGPFLPEEFDAPCEDCGAPAGAYCRSGCPSGYTADDARADALRHRP